jgi:hypothetical protein
MIIMGKNLINNYKHSFDLDKFCNLYEILFSLSIHHNKLIRIRIFKKYYFIDFIF